MLSKDGLLLAHLYWRCLLIYISISMIKLIKKWMNEWTLLNQELNDLGMHFHCTAYGAWIQYINPETQESINTTDDKS